MVLRYNFALLLTIQFAFFFCFVFFPAKILSGPYLWNRYSQRLQIECAAWSCGLIVHCCLPSNSLCYFFFYFFLFFHQDFVRAISLEPFPERLQIECAAWSCGLILHCCLPSNSLCYFLFLFYFFFFPPPRNDFVRAISLEPFPERLQIECAAWSCSLILHCCLPSNSLCYFLFLFIYFFFFPPRFCPGHISGTVP